MVRLTSIGPAAKNDALRARTAVASGLALLSWLASTVMDPSPSVPTCTFTPSDRSTSVMAITSFSIGTLRMVTGSRHAIVPASKARTAFFAPPTDANPSSRPPPSTSRYPPPAAPKASSEDDVFPAPSCSAAAGDDTNDLPGLLHLTARLDGNGKRHGRPSPPTPHVRR